MKYPYSICNIIKDKDKGITWIKKEEYGKLNPNGTVPTVIWETGENYFESGAILDMIQKKNPKNKFFENCENWSESQILKNDLYKFWCIATIDNRIITWKSFAAVFVGGSLSNSLLISNSDKKWWIKEVCPIIEKDLDECEDSGGYINGEFSITDIYLGYTLAHVYHCGLMESTPKKIQNYYKKIVLRPGFKKSFEGTFFKIGVE